MTAVRTIAEAGPVGAMPLTEPPVEGVTAVEGRAVLQIDAARALGRSSGNRPGRVVVVVATAVGDLALRVDDARWTSTADAGHPALGLADLLPWTGGTVPAAGAFLPRAAAVATLPLMRVRRGTEEVALRVDRLEQVERAAWVAALPDPAEPADALIAVGDALLPARPLPACSSPPLQAGTDCQSIPYALVLRGDAPDERAALLVERAFGVERCPADRLIALSHPGGGGSLWWRRDAAPPLRVVDPGPLFGWSAGSTVEIRPDAAAGHRGGIDTAQPRTLTVERDGVALALPLALVAEVLTGGDAGTGSRVRLAGSAARRRPVLRVDRVRPLEAGTTESVAAAWQSLTTLPPAAALLFDAARWDAATERWVFRVNPDTVTQPPAKRVAWAARRALLAAWRGWADGATLGGATHGRAPSPSHRPPPAEPTPQPDQPLAITTT